MSIANGLSTSVDSGNTTFILNNANRSVIELIAGQQAIQELARVDDFVENFSRFDLESRLNTTVATKENYLEFVGKQILDWDNRSTSIVSSSIHFINTNCIDRLKLLMYPSKIYIILTNGNDENGAAYCRSDNIIVLSRCMVNAKQTDVIIHELFHIWSKQPENLSIRDDLYASIGYHKIPGETVIEFPSNLAAVKMTNPDAPITMKYYIELRKKGDETKRKFKCTPILHASQPFDANFSTNFFTYLVATNLILDDITYQPLQPLQFLSYEQADDFYDQIGSNTGYIIHPEEILAENFVLWMQQNSKVKKITTPSIINRMNEIISLASMNK